ncbi:DUF350 domain-containing protein [Rubrivirga marina]|uniref:DUF350 domain-containing protein n=1 Tax=Rubrivirga marina TaxID=1196024 RepID=A0A271J083_9BACT|nr:DUF350 domain-containing protein [Rubrivirga marina]PAP76149.1 hypothetical protein BSZ37_06660 [Rubrivirga marina]
MRPRLAPLVALLLAVPAAAQDVIETVPVPPEAADLSLTVVLSTLVYGAIGILMCVLGYVVFDKVAGLNLKHELVEDQNVAVGIMLAGAFIGIAIVVASVMLS